MLFAVDTTSSAYRLGYAWGPFIFLIIAIVTIKLLVRFSQSQEAKRAAAKERKAQSEATDGSPDVTEP